MGPEMPILHSAVNLLLAVLSAVTTLTFSTLAGTPGTVVNGQDGTGNTAQFDAPRGLAVDRAGNIYVADTRNNTVRKVSPDGTVTTLAGTAGTEGLANGDGAAARFNEPFGVAVDDDGNVYVADASNNAIRKISAGGTVTTLAGGGGPGSADGSGANARLDEPRGIARDSNGTLYVADYDNHLIRKVTTSGVVTTLAGQADVPGNADGLGTAASFRGPMGIAVDAAGIVYVADSGNRAIRRIAANGMVTTLSLSGQGLSEPRGIAIAASGAVVVADYGAHCIRSISSSGVVSTLAGAASEPGTTDATGTAARFHYPSAIAVTSAGTMYVADTDNDTLRSMTASAVVTTLAGQAGRSNTADGQGPDARFDDPFAAAVDADGVVYVADSAAHVIRRITPDGTATTYAGTPGSYGIDDGTAFNARFYSPKGVAVDSAGNVYVADSGNSTVRKVAPGGVVTTLAGAGRTRGSADGTGANARFDQPFGIAVDQNGNVYVSDATANTIRKITAAGVVTTLAGQAGSSGSTDGAGAAARFTVPYGVAVDTAGNVFVVDHGNHTIRKVTPSGTVTTLAGSAGTGGSTDGRGAAASFRYPSGVAVDRGGTVYVADTDNHLIRAISADGEVTTAGGSGSPGSTDGAGTAARFFNPKGVAADAMGRIYVADLGNHVIRVGAPTP
jgi:sugar lactone lactonase YvrE